MMRLPTFRLLQPGSLEEAATALAESPATTRLVAGGTDLFPNLKRRHQSAETVIAMGNIPGLDAIEQHPSGGIRIGAMCTLTAMAGSDLLRDAHPGLVCAVASISAPVLRNMGTLGGNVLLDTRCTYYNQNEEWRRAIGYCKKEQGEICWVAPGSPRCWAISATDSAPVLCALGAEVELVSVRGKRRLKLADLYVDDGIAYLAKERDEILSYVFLPPKGLKSTYWKLRRRGSIDFPVLGVGAALTQGAGGVIEDCRIWLGAVRSAPVRAEAAEQALIGEKATDENLAQAAVLARKPASPLDNTDFVVSWRVKMVERYVEGALRELCGLPATVRRPEHGTWALRQG